jgi:nitrogen-specific signal transduction histidine kinase/CheY-like chemotaxis protein
MMRAILGIMTDEALGQALRAAVAETDLLILTPSVDDALRKLVSFQADVAIVDEGSGAGRQVMDRFREAAPHVPIIVISNRADEETRSSYVAAGARACLPKPFDCAALQDAIDQACGAPLAAPVQPAPSLGALSGLDPVRQHQAALRWLSRATQSAAQPERLAESLMEALADVFGIVRGAVLLEEGQYVRVAASLGLDKDITVGLNLSPVAGLMAWFEARASQVDRDAPAIDPGALKTMEILGARLASPIMCHGHARGAIVIGEKSSGLPYSADERELLSTMARCASVAMENGRLNESAQRDQERLATILTNITAGVVVVDEERRITMMNASAERVLNVRASDLMGQSVQKLGSAFANIILRTMKDGQPRLRQSIRDAAIDAQLGVSATVMPDNGAVAVFASLPEESEADEDVVYSPFWEYLASRVAQEVKNPMVAINTFAQLLPRKYDSLDFRETFGEVVQKEIARINGVVDTLNEFAHKPHLLLQESDVNQTVRGVLDSFEADLQSRSIALDATWDSQLPTAELDPIFFSQALHNIVQNSIEAMPEGGTLHVQTRRHKGDCEVIVTDTGSGVTNQDAPHIFMPFFSTKEKGMGLGLTLAVRILRQHEGDLTLEPCDEGGSAFALRVPSVEETHANHPSH